MIMIPTRERKDGEEGSIRIGATGKVSALMMQELDSVLSNTSTSCKRRSQTSPVSISCGVSTSRLQQRKASSKTVGRLVATSSSHHRTPGGSIQQRKKQNVRQSTTQGIPMLGSENVSVGNTPNRSKPEKKRLQIVEVVNLKCGKLDAALSYPIGNQLRRLSFSKLSEF